MIDLFKRELLIIGDPGIELRRALRVIDRHLHAAFDRTRGIVPGVSKRSCVLASLAVRDFLRKVGFGDAVLSPVYFVIEAVGADGEVIHNAGMGESSTVPKSPDCIEHQGGWEGHVVVRVPSRGYLIDATLYQVRRPAWSNLPGMFAVPYANGLPEVWGMRPLATLGTHNPDGSTLSLWWLDQSQNQTWRLVPDAARDRRIKVVSTLARKYGALT